jgi:hypothetical protein
MSPSSLGGGKQTTTAGEHISLLVETLIGDFSSKEEKFEQWRYNCFQYSKDNAVFHDVPALKLLIALI